MANFTLMLFLAVPALWREDADAILEAKGFGSGNFSIRLTNRDDGATSHYGLWTAVRPSFADWLASATAGEVAVEGANPERVALVLQMLRVSVVPREKLADAGASGWEDFLEAERLRKVYN